MRDALKDEAYFLGFIAKKKAFLPKYVERFQDVSLDHRKRLGFAYDFFRNSAHIAVATYASGAPISDVRTEAINAIDALMVFSSLGEEDPEYFLHGDAGGYSGGFDHWYRLLGWCVLFDLPRPTCDIVIEYLRLQMRNPAFAADALLDRMIRHLGYPGEGETDHLLWPEAYGPLHACFTQSEPSLDKQLEGFMKRWYGAMRTTYWHNTHDNPHNVYFGYWCFEAAAVSKMLDIDDAALKAHPNYPYEARHRAE